jgi:alkylation response protein AidB-like acyl-CoA dehydrogenase
MDFLLTADQQNIREAIVKHCSRFPDEYWLERDRDGVFPHEFYKSMVEAGWLGISMPAEFGGYLRESLIPRTAPVSAHMILNFLAEKVLGLPKSY